jgi:diguanylate cyclase (GGDEF)-like protein
VPIKLGNLSRQKAPVPMGSRRATTNLGREPTPTSGPVWAFAVLLALLGLILSMLVMHVAQPGHPHPSVPWPVVALALLAVLLLPVRFHSGRSTHTVDLFVVPAILGGVFTPQPELLVAVVLACAAATTIRRNDPIRWVFNVGNQLSGVAAAVLVLDEMPGQFPYTNLKGWLALSVAMFTYEVVTFTCVSVVVTLTSGLPTRQYFRSIGFQVALVLPLNCAVGILAVTACASNPWSLMFLAGPAVALMLWYRSANTLRNRFSDLQSLYGFSINLASLTERHEVLAIALRETKDILHCEHAELIVPKTRRSGLRYQIDGDGQVRRVPCDLTSLEKRVVSDHTALFVPRNRTDQSVAERGFDDLMAVPVPISDKRSAVLVAADRQGKTATFEAQDLRLFEALAAHLSTALTSSGRLDQLRHEVAAREHEAFHDNLTGLANRSLFSQVVGAALDNRQPSQLVAVMLMDLDGFKEINDTLGHHTGDLILKEVGARVDAAIGPDRLAARLGGDEFAFVISATTRMDQVFAAANDVLEAVATPLSVDGIVLSLRASIGIAIGPIHGSDTASLLKRADVAMYAAKSSSRGVIVYDPKIDHYSTRRLILASELQRAIAGNELEVWYQPVAELPSGQIVGFEALLRWRHPEYGPISPDEFIPVAEQTGLIETLTTFVLRVSLEELRRWRDDGFEFDMAVNVSARSLFDTEIVDRLRNLLAETGVSAESLTLEITESSMMLDSERSERILRQLSQLGLRIAIDDFGTGYSSLSRLKVLPVQLVKIDRSFVQHLCTDKGDEAIVRSTIGLARNMGHMVVAEGVEDRATWDRLDQLGCDLAQGYFLSAAMPADQCREWLRTRQTPTLAPIRVLRPLAEGA